MSKDIFKANLKAVENATVDIRKFIAGFLDADSIVETDVFFAGKSFLSGESAEGEGVVTGYATVSGMPVQFFAQNNAVLKGSMSAAHADKIVKCFERAEKTGTPIISVIDTAGARIGEGTTVLEGYAKVLAAAARRTVNSICIVKGNAVGMMASFVALSNVVIMSDKAILSLTPPMVIAAAEKGNFSKIETLLGYKAHSPKNNIANFTYKTDSELKKTLVSVCDILFNKHVQALDDPNREFPALDKSVTLSGIVAALFDDGNFIEYALDNAPEMRCLLGRIDGLSVGVTMPGKDKKITRMGLSKVDEFVRLLSNNDLPFVSLVDYDEIENDISAEHNGLSIQVAMLTSAISRVDIPKISVVTGRATGLAYSALASKGIGFDYSLAFANAEISPISAKTAVEILYADDIKKSKDAGKARELLAKQYETTEASPFVSAKDGFIDNIILPSTIRPYVASALLMLLGA